MSDTAADLQVPARSVALFGNGFGLLLSSALSYHLVSTADRFTFSWLVDVDLNRDSWAGFVVFCLGLPVFCLILIAGAIADRSDRRRQLLASQVAGLVVSVFLAVFTKAGWMNLPLAIVGAIAFGTAFAFAAPVRSALVPSLVAPRRSRPQSLR